jgi:hypothetical protein
LWGRKLFPAHLIKFLSKYRHPRTISDKIVSQLLLSICMAVITGTGVNAVQQNSEARGGF